MRKPPSAHFPRGLESSNIQITMATGDFVLRDFATEADYDACVALQQETWGEGFRELVGPALLKVAQRVGGLAAGAFDPQGALAAFVFGITGIQNGELVHWSHMLAVRPASRDQGLGRRLKLYQRDRMRALGITRIRWTFDPLVARNAHLNLNVLGTRVAQYVPDMYGADPASRIDRVIGSDRFVVVWTLGREPPQRAAPQWPDAPVVARPAMDDTLPDHSTVLVEIPQDIQGLKDVDAEAARDWRALTRRALTHYLDRHYRITGLVRSPENGRVAYRLVAGAEYV